MNYEQYITDATRTESVLDHLRANEDRLRAVMEIVIASTQMLDLLKKNIFYAKEVQMKDWVSLCKQITKSTFQARNNVGREVPRFGGLTDPTRSNIDFDSRIAHSIIGINTEAGELLEAMLAAMDGESFDIVNFGEELGDIQWYTAIGIEAAELDFDNILKVNIDKLKARYPDKFTVSDAINRDLDNEREILDHVVDPSTGELDKVSKKASKETVKKTVAKRKKAPAKKTVAKRKKAPAKKSPRKKD